MAWAGWRADYGAWKAAVLRNGLPALVVGVELLPPWDGHRILVIALDIDETLLPRRHSERGFCLHISLAFDEELTEELALAAIRVHQRWAGRPVRLQIEWVGSGGAAFLNAADPLAADADVQRLHHAGWYTDRQLHVSL